MSNSLNKLQVVVRVRTLLPSDKVDHGLSDLVVDVNEPEGQVIVGLSKSFAFDTCFDRNALQEQIYQQSVAPIVRQFLHSMCHTSILAYGQTGAGKTHTMFGMQDAPGIIPNSIRDIFDAVDLREVSVGVSFFEIYNEKLFDLMNTNKVKVPMALREEGSHFLLPHLTTKWVSNFDDAMSAVHHGCSTRSIGSTAQNQNSSRSHAIFRLTVAKISDVTGQRIEAKLNLVDLAGSESVAKTNANGVRLEEANNINKGLLALGNCISAISEKKGHIPFRDSTLTKILRECLQGDGLTTFIACISPTEVDMAETLSTLRYADRAKNLKKPPIPQNLMAQAQASAKKRRLEPKILPTPAKWRINSTFDNSKPTPKKGHPPPRLNTTTPIDLRSPPIFATSTMCKKPISQMALLEESDEMSEVGSMSDLSSIPGGPSTSSVISYMTKSCVSNMINTNQSIVIDPATLSPMFRKFAAEMEDRLFERLERTICGLRRSPRLAEKSQKEATAAANVPIRELVSTIGSTDVSSDETLSANETVISGIAFTQARDKIRQQAATINDVNELDLSEDFTLKKVTGLKDRTNQHRKRSNMYQVEPTASPSFGINSEDKENVPEQSPKRRRISLSGIPATPPISVMAKELGINLESPGSILRFPTFPPPQCQKVRKSDRRRSTRRTTMIAPELKMSLSEAGVTSQRRQSSRIANKVVEFKNPFEVSSNWTVFDQEKHHQNILGLLNSANLSMLQKLPAIGPKSAYLIHAHRERNRGLKSLEDLKNIPGLQKNFFSKFTHAHQLKF